MATSELIDLQNKMHDWVAKAMATVEWIRTPPDMKVFVESTARLIAKKGLDYEKRLMKSHPHVNFNFLKSSEDPFHGYYQQKLTEYLSDQKNHHQEEDGIIELPPDKRDLIVRTARFVARVGYDFENMNPPKDPNLSFLVSSDPFHGFYQHKLTEFLSHKFRVQDCEREDALEIARTELARYLSSESFMNKSDPFHAYGSRSHQNQQDTANEELPPPATGTSSQPPLPSHEEGPEHFKRQNPGFLEDNRSLAHYNLTLFLSEDDVL